MKSYIQGHNINLVIYFSIWLPQIVLGVRNTLTPMSLSSSLINPGLLKCWEQSTMAAFQQTIATKLAYKDQAMS